MGRVATRSFHSIIAPASGGPTEKTSRVAGLIRTRLRLQHGRWVLVHDIPHWTVIGGAGIGGRLPVSVRRDRDCYLWVFYNIFLGTLLLKNLHEARGMAKRCVEICKDFERQTDQGTVKEWKAMKREWERDPSKPDPYKLVEKRGSVGHIPVEDR